MGQNCTKCCWYFYINLFLIHLLEKNKNVIDKNLYISQSKRDPMINYNDNKSKNEGNSFFIFYLIIF